MARSTGNGGFPRDEDVFRDPWIAPGYDVLQGVVDKWGPLVICALRKGPRRYGELRRAIGPVSQKMLTQTLRKLESYGLVGRKALDTAPPRVEYSLTSLGESLTGPLEDVFRWAEAHRDEMPAVRHRPNGDRSAAGPDPTA